MGRTGPPADIEPAALFRLLLRTPRPTAPVLWQPPGSTDIAPTLTVRALTLPEDGAVADDAAALPAGAGLLRRTRSLIAAALLDESGLLAFATADDVPDQVVYELGEPVLTALARISPSYMRSDVEAWSRVLGEGARHISNYALTRALGSCVDVSVGWGMTYTSERPDRWLGLRQADMTTGHWMAFRVARRVVMEEQNAASK